MEQRTTSLTQGGGGLIGFHRTEGFETWTGKGWFGVVERR